MRSVGRARGCCPVLGSVTLELGTRGRQGPSGLCNGQPCLTRPPLRLLSLPGRSSMYLSFSSSLSGLFPWGGGKHPCLHCPDICTAQQWQGFCSLRTPVATLWASVMSRSAQRLIPGTTPSDVLFSLGPGHFLRISALTSLFTQTCGLVH